MRRKRGRAKSSASNPDPQTNGIVSTSPEAGPRRSKRSSSNAPVPSKASRLQPTTPLHMTTRRAASHAATNSTANSDASADSRRSSLGESTAHVGGFDIDAERPAKRSRLSDRSNASTNERASRNFTPEAKPTTRRLRKEDSFDIPSLSFDGDVAQNGTLSMDPSENGDTTAIRDQVDEEDADVIRDLKPIALTPRRRGRGRRPRIVQQNLSVESGNESIGQGTPARSASRVHGDGMDSDPDRLARIVKRLPGRRRAPNPNLSIEADLRRQLHLKMGYRAVAKALKPVLVELAKRAVNELATNEEYHMESEEYEFLKAQLDKLLQRRLQVLENERNILSESQERSRKVHSEGAQQLFEDYVLSLQDNYLTVAKHAMLNLERDQNEDVDSDATEDEGSIEADEEDAIPHTLVKYGVIQPLHNSVSLHRPTGRLDSRFDSRSRVFMETDRHWRRSQYRWRVRATAAEVVDKNPDELEASQLLATSFGTTDYTRRPQAIAKLNVRTLAEAADDVEAEAKKERDKPVAKVIPNEEAEGLQALVSGMELLSTVVPGQQQEQLQLLHAFPPALGEAPQQHWNLVPGYGSIAQQLEPQERATRDGYPGAGYYDPTKPALSSHDEALRYEDAPKNAERGRPPRGGDGTIDNELPYDYYVRIGAISAKRQSFDGGHSQRQSEIAAAEHRLHEQHTPTPPKWVVPQKQHSRTSSAEEKSSRERSTSFRRHTSPDVGHDPYTAHVKHESSQTPLPPEAAVAQPGNQPPGVYNFMLPMESIPEYQRLGPVAFPGSASSQHGQPQTPGYPAATPAAPQGAIPPPLHQSEPPYRRASETVHWRSDYDRHEANKARLSHLRPNRPMTIEEEIAALRERHTPHHMRDRKGSGEMRPRSETISEPQQSKRPSLALDTAAGSESRTRGPSTAPVHASPLATPTQSAGPRQMSPLQLLQRAPPPDGRRETPPSHAHNPRSLSLGGIPLEPPTTPYGYGPPSLQPGYSPYGPPPPPGYAPPSPQNQAHYNANAYASNLPPGYGSQPPTPSQQGKPAIFQPILPNNPPNSMMTPTYSGPQYRGTPIQPANPPVVSGGPTAPPFGPAFSQISTTANGDRPGNGLSGRGGRPRGRGIRTGETVFSHYQGPPGEKNGKFKEL